MEEDHCRENDEDRVYLSPAGYLEHIREQSEQLEWLWANCRIVYYPKDPPGAYPIEHAPGAGKDMRAVIEAEMRKAGL